MEATVQKDSCTERCDVGISLRPYLSRRLQDRPSCLESNGGDVDLLLDESTCQDHRPVDRGNGRFVCCQDHRPVKDGMVDLFVFESTDRIVQNKLNAQSLRLFGLHSDVNDAHCAGANRLQNKNSKGIVHPTCGHLMRENPSILRIHRWQSDILSIPNYVTKKGRPHGNRHGKTEEKRKHFIAHNFRTRNSEEIMHPEGRGGAERFHLSHVVRRVYEIQKDLVYLSEHIWHKCAEETPIRLQRSINKDAPSSP